MGHIAEPKRVDFTIQSPPLTESERKELSTFIKKRKEEIEKETALEEIGKSQKKESELQ